MARRRFRGLRGLAGALSVPKAPWLAIAGGLLARAAGSFALSKLSLGGAARVKPLLDGLAGGLGAMLVGKVAKFDADVAAATSITAGAIAQVAGELGAAGMLGAAAIEDLSGVTFESLNGAGLAGPYGLELKGVDIESLSGPNVQLMGVR